MKIIKFIVSLLAILCVITSFKTEGVCATIGLLLMVMIEVEIYYFAKGVNNLRIKQDKKQFLLAVCAYKKCFARNVYSKRDEGRKISYVVLVMESGSNLGQLP